MDTWWPFYTLDYFFSSLCSLDPADKQICDCDPNKPNPCGPDSDCINRHLMTECQPSCRAKDNCLNQRFLRRSYPPLKVIRTPNRGWGLHVLNDVKKGNFQNYISLSNMQAKVM